MNPIRLIQQEPAITPKNILTVLGKGPIARAELFKHFDGHHKMSGTDPVENPLLPNPDGIRGGALDSHLRLLQRRGDILQVGDKYALPALSLLRKA